MFADDGFEGGDFESLERHQAQRLAQLLIAAEEKLHGLRPLGAPQQEPEPADADGGGAAPAGWGGWGKPVDEAPDYAAWQRAFPYLAVYAGRSYGKPVGAADDGREAAAGHGCGDASDLGQGGEGPPSRRDGEGGEAAYKVRAGDPALAVRGRAVARAAAGAAEDAPGSEVLAEDGVLEEILAVDRGLAPDESALARHSSREGAPPSPAEEVVEELLEDLARGIWGVLREPALALASDVGRAADPSGAA